MEGKQKSIEISRTALVIGGIVMAVGLILAILIGNFYIVIACFALLMAILFFSLSMSARKVRKQEGASGEVVFLFVTIIFLVLSGVMFSKSDPDVASLISNRIYTAGLGRNASQIMATTDSEGEKYAVYDKDAGIFLANCLPKDLCAEKADDIGAVFIVSIEKVKSRTYSDGTVGYACRANIALVSLSTGEELGSTTVSGDAPPDIIHSGTFWPVVGSKPTAEDIGDACASLLKKLDLIGS